MGRGGAGGSSGGGGSSSGGFASRSTSGGWGGSQGSHRGGFSGPSSSHSSSSSRSYSSDYEYRPAPPRVIRQPRWNKPLTTFHTRREYRRYRTGRRFASFWEYMGSVIWTIIIAWIVLWILNAVSTSSTAIKNTTQRTKLQSEALSKTETIIDDKANWLTNYKHVRGAMNYFMSKTGIQPMLIISEDLEGKKNFQKQDVDKYLEAQYNTNFKDEAHMIFYFCEPEKERYYRGLYVGIAASTVMDDEAQSILYKYVDKYYYSDLTDDEYFYKIFVSTADKIMEKVTSYNDVLKSRNRWAAIIVIIVAGIGGLMRLSELRRKEKEEAAKILSSNIFADDNIAS